MHSSKEKTVSITVLDESTKSNSSLCILADAKAEELLHFAKGNNSTEYYIYSDRVGELSLNESFVSQGIKNEDQLISNAIFCLLSLVYHISKLPKKYITIVDKVNKVTKSYTVNFNMTIMYYLSKHWTVHNTSLFSL